MADLADLAAHIVTTHPGLAAATDALRTAHGHTLPTSEYLAAVRAAKNDALAAATQRTYDLSNLPELADIALVCYPDSVGKAVRALRDADTDHRGWTLPMTDYIAALHGARDRQQAA